MFCAYVCSCTYLLYSNTIHFVENNIFWQPSLYHSKMLTSISQIRSWVMYLDYVRHFTLYDVFK